MCTEQYGLQENAKAAKAAAQKAQAAELTPEQKAVKQVKDGDALVAAVREMLRWQGHYLRVVVACIRWCARFIVWCAHGACC